MIYRACRTGGARPRRETPGSSEPVGVRHTLGQRMDEPNAAIRRLVDEVESAVTWGMTVMGGANYPDPV